VKRDQCVVAWAVNAIGSLPRGLGASFSNLLFDSLTTARQLIAGIFGSSAWISVLDDSGM